MNRCVNCAWFPWKLGADLSGLPAMRCHPELAARRWSKVGAETETSCPLYEVVELESETPDHATEVKAVEPAPETEAQANAKPAPKTKPKAKSKSRTKKE